MKQRLIAIFSVLVLMLGTLSGMVVAQDAESDENTVYDGRFTFTVPAAYTLTESGTNDLVRADSDETGTFVVVGPNSYSQVIGGQDFETEDDALAFYLERTGYTVGESSGMMRMVDGVLGAYDVTLARRGTEGTGFLVDIENGRTGVVIALGDYDGIALEGLLTSLDYPADIVDIAVADDDFNTLVAAVQAAGLESTLRDTELTVFAPTDAAFETLLEELDMSADDLLANTDLLTAVLQYHVTEDLITIPQEVTMLNGETVTAGTMLNDDVTVVTPNIEAFNGVIHVIDTVLVPQAALDMLAEMEEEAEATEEAMEEEAEEEDDS
jgi:uncharacterized surface protein with fasciclin (FAS1) repeats